MRLENKVCIITGGGQGIGEAIAMRLAVEGARVVIAEINAENAQRVAGEINAMAGEALALPTDISDTESVTEMAKTTIEKYGRIDVLMNNAAVYAGLKMKPFDEISADEWQRVMAVNLNGMFYCTRAVVPYMRQQGFGRVINMTSGAFHLPVPGLAHSITSKGAIIGFTRALACELGDSGITVNAIAPGFVMTKASLELAPPGMAEAIASRQCIKRSEQSEDIVGTVVFLASDDSAFMTGQTLTVDGGTSFH